MLFPVYWMFNVSLTATSDMRQTRPTGSPGTPRSRATPPSLGQQLPALATSLLIGLGTVALTWSWLCPPGTRWPSCDLAAAGPSTSCCWSRR